MNTMFVVLVMIFFHIVDDYYLQGWLSSAKTKEYWQENAPGKLYRFDYIWALIMHSFSWTFMVMLPIVFVENMDIGISFAVVFMINIAIHAAVDDLKANKRKISLWEDQIMHLGQILSTAIILL